MIADSDGLLGIANTDRPNLRADVVFVHGLAGASHTTWCYGKPGTPGCFFWPAELAEDLPDCAIWSVGYPAGFTVLGKPGMIIEKRAGNLAQKLANGGLGGRPLLFITHSMGGLVVKSLLVDSQTQADPDRKRIAAAVAGIVFCATPHRGSAFADAAGVLGAFFGGSQRHVDEMRANAEPLDFLHEQFIEWHRRHPIPIDSYAENVGLFRKRWFRRPLPLGVVVPRASANPGIAGHTVKDVDEDHLTLVKPPARGHDVYAGVLRFLQGALVASEAPPRVDVPIAATAREPVGDDGAAFDADISRIDRYAPARLLGRDEELRLLTDAWEKARQATSPRPRVVSIVALGGEGKTSLAAKWAAELAALGWPGCETAFAWSFYHQGTEERTADSSDLFLKEALTIFGDPLMANSPASALEKGRRLAHLLGGRRALLILDGVEPLQYPPTSPQAGELKDQGLSALLKGLAASGRGLCVVTTRYSIQDLRNYWQTTAPEIKLTRLSQGAGVDLLTSLGVHGARRDLEQLVTDVQGHALTLSLFGGYLREAHAGDIRKRDLVELQEADTEQRGGHAFRVMGAYVDWLASDGERGQAAISLLRMMGLFDRPASADCIAALAQKPVIPGLTEAISRASQAQLNVALARLHRAKLVTVRNNAASQLESLEVHPLVREYFARQLRTDSPDTWRSAHQRLYQHLLATTSEGSEPTLDSLQTLYHGIAHGCAAGLHEEALHVYVTRIQRGAVHYASKKLGALGANLGAVAHFFDEPWTDVVPNLDELARAWLLGEAAFYLRDLGRLNEAVAPMNIAVDKFVELKSWSNAASNASNLAELQVLLGNLEGALALGDLSVSYADQSDSMLLRMSTRSIQGNILHQLGRMDDAEKAFHDAEALQVQRQPDYPLLYTLQGFQFCDLLLSVPEKAAWQRSVAIPASSSDGHTRAPQGAGTREIEFALGQCREVARRAAMMFLWRVPNDSLLGIAIEHLALARAELYSLILARDSKHLASARSNSTAAVDGLRRASKLVYLPQGLLTRAWLRFVIGDHTGPESAQTDLDEAWEIAERGPMPLFLADIQLHRAMLFHAIRPYPWSSGPEGRRRGPRDDLAAARRLIEDCGYWRRKEELADAERASTGWPQASPED